MKTFSIAELEQYSLIRAHTFRTWEQRFFIVKAKRTETRLRYYTLEDLSFLLDLALLNRLGSKVSALAPLKRDVIRERVLHLKEETARQENAINQLIILAFSLQIEDFELVLDSAVTFWGIDQTIEEVILPFLERLELFSYNGRTGSEYHFVVTAVRKKLIVAIEGVNPKQTLPKSALLFLPEGEHYDLLLLYMNYKLRKAGVNVLYLGTNISAKTLRAVIEIKQPQFAVTYLSTSHGKKAKELFAYLKNQVDTSYLISGPHAIWEAETLFTNLRYVPYREATKELLSLT